MTNAIKTGVPLLDYLLSALPITVCFPIMSAEERRKLDEQERAKLQSLITELPELPQFVDLALKRKHPILKHSEFKLLATALVEKNNLLWQDDRAVSMLRDNLKKQGIIVLPKELAPPLHDYCLTGNGMDRLMSLERKIRIKN